ncbi:hypothetical protein DSS3P8_189 [Roseobacter phage DSS3P8]|nr:hypothetical protein DSS3P8_189 [Roseobacter phage DSS3P8]
MINGEYIDRTMTRYARRYGMYDAPAPAPESLITKAMRPLTRVERFKAWLKSWLS